MQVNNNSAEAFQVFNETFDSQEAWLTKTNIREPEKQTKAKKERRSWLPLGNSPSLEFWQVQIQILFQYRTSSVSIARLNIEISMLYSWWLMKVLSNQPSTSAHHGDDDHQPIMEMMTIGPSWRWSPPAHHGDDHHRPVMEMITTGPSLR